LGVPILFDLPAARIMPAVGCLLSINLSPKKFMLNDDGSLKSGLPRHAGKYQSPRSHPFSGDFLRSPPSAFRIAVKGLNVLNVCLDLSKACAP
jgi:hypothetical protein